MIKEKQLYEPLEDIDVICMTSWRAPFTGGYDRILPKGERFRVSHDPVEGATAVYCDPIRYKQLHKTMVPWKDRLQFLTYAGYYLCIKLDSIKNKCRKVE